MPVSRDTSNAGAIQIEMGGAGEAPPTQQRNMKDFKRRASCCVKVAPWVSTLSCLMVGVGLGVWYVYTKRSLAYTQDITLQLFQEPLNLVQELSNVLGWTTLLMAIVVSCLLGITVFVSLMRTYQFSARLPETSCGAPGKLSYGSYAGFIAILNFGWWLLTIVVSLLIAGNLVWLTVAFLFSSALSMGVTYTPDAAVPSAEFYSTARSAMDALTTYASVVQPKVPETVAAQPDVQGMNTNINNFLTASKDVPVTVCPVNCLNMGSFYDALQLKTSCICTEANIDGLRNTATDTWEAQVHVLAALALMGLGCLWQLMNMSANFAHARRDMREQPGRNIEQFLTGDAIAAVHASPYTPSKKTYAKTAARDQDAGHTADTGFPTTTEFVGVSSMAETMIEPAAPVEHMTYNSAYETYQDTNTAEAPAATPQRRASSPSPRNGEAEQPSPSSGGRGATFNTTAQRYAAYRLRAAQAAAAKGSPSSEGGRKQWVR